MLYQPTSIYISESSQQVHVQQIRCCLTRVQDGMKTLHGIGWISVIHASCYVSPEKVKFVSNDEFWTSLCGQSQISLSYGRYQIF